MAKPPIRVFLVEDSPIAMVILTRILSTAPDIEVVGTARTGVEALNLIPTVQPDVICTDLHMPQMGGLELTRHLMARYPRPILVISASVGEDDQTHIFEVLDAGAVDVFPKPQSGLSSDYEGIKQALLNKVRVLAGVKVFTQYRRGGMSTMPAQSIVQTFSSPLKNPFSGHGAANDLAPRHEVNARSSAQPIQAIDKAIDKAIDIRAPRVIAIAASTGGPNALHTVLQSFPTTLPVPVLCVQHISEGFLSGLVDWLNRECAVSVKVAQPGELPQPGTVYFAPENYHLEISAAGRLVCQQSPFVAGHRPSATVLFQSVAAYYRRSVVAALLTGMGRDGADGLLTIAQAGGTTLVQDESSCVVFGMPKEAIALGSAQHILPIGAIAPHILRLF